MRLKKGGFVYIMANESGSKVYTGSTSELIERVLKHKTGFYPNSFTALNRCHKLVFYQHFPTVTAAYTEEQRIKGGSRRKKDRMINGVNPEWRDLYFDLID